MARKSGKLFDEKIFRESNKAVTTSSLELNLIKLMNVFGVSAFFDLDIVLAAFRRARRNSLAHASEDFFFVFSRLRIPANSTERYIGAGFAPSFPHKGKAFRAFLKLRTNSHENTMMFFALETQVAENCLYKLAILPIKSWPASNSEMTSATSGLQLRQHRQQ